MASVNSEFADRYKKCEEKCKPYAVEEYHMGCRCDRNSVNE